MALLSFLAGKAGNTHFLLNSSQRLEAQRDLEQARQQLLQAQKLAAIGQLTGGIVHDFNNMLTVILSAVSLMERGIDNKQRSLQLLRLIRDSAHRGEKLNKQLLSFSRRRPLRPEVIDVPRQLTLAIRANNLSIYDPSRPDRYVAISLADSGAGIPEDLHQKVLEPFFTTKAPEKGTGLGLSQAHAFATQSGGWLDLQSKLGEGTTVTFYLPCWPT